MKLARPTARTTALVLATLVLAACAAAAESDTEVSVSDVRMPIPAGPNAAVYMTMTNEGSADAQLTGAATDVTDAVELHETELTDGSMQMQQLEAIDIPAGGTTTLEPGGLHVMLIGVGGDFAEGDTVDLTLSFADGAEQDVTAEVVPLTEAGDHSMGSEMPMDGMASEMPMDGSSEMDMESSG